ncbi:MAG TPA: hypothetical protein VMU89_14680 [Thermomicrobiaceae bacterium]|nr:hypothetical protein [Thermomicrobiaceae bacterium]
MSADTFTELEDVVTHCESCGAEDPVMAAKVRTFRLTHAGNDPKVPATPLRAPLYCARCRANLDALLGSIAAGTAKTITVKRNGPEALPPGPMLPTR